MEEIRITLHAGVIATTQRQKDTVEALKLRHRHDSRVVKATPALQGMVDAVRHLVSVGKPEDLPVDPFQGVPEYELGSVTEKKPVEKKKKEPKPASEASAEAPKKSAKGGEGKAAPKAKAKKKAPSTAHKKTSAKAK